MTTTKAWIASHQGLTIWALWQTVILIVGGLALLGGGPLDSIIAVAVLFSLLLTAGSLMFYFMDLAEHKEKL